jgi:hypothetical protein
MSAAVPPKSQICSVIEQLRPDQLAQLWEFVEKLIAAPSDAPLYHIHEQAISTGIRDLADQHDHYLYGVEKHDA